VVPGHPHVLRTAVFDIITPDLEYGPAAAAAETIAVVEDCMNTFPALGSGTEIRITHNPRQWFGNHITVYF
jgi:eukaryotic translation initiation factor 2-alpha kinase 4